MKQKFLLTFVMLIQSIAAAAQTDAGNSVVTVRIEPGNGYSYPFYLYVPESVRPRDGDRARLRDILVVPNNTGKPDDDLAVHENAVKQKMMQAAFVFGKLDVPVLMPVFPRPASDWKIYTHALDRDSLITEKDEYRRFDLQLLAMIDAARETLVKRGIATGERVLMYGFSAAGMFVNRFAFLHPERVRAVAVGSPGGWPIAPVEEFRRKKLPYPIGSADLKNLSGKALDLKTLRKVPFFVFMGDADENDSVVFKDGYEDSDKALIFELFGETPAGRWETSKSLYSGAGLEAVFKLYPGTNHKVTGEMVTDVIGFLEKHKSR